jgi:hypothetical protein
MKPDRLPCLVPWCRRTRKREHFREWICGKHWTLVDRDLRRRFSRSRRLWQKATRLNRDEAMRAIDLSARRQWDWIKDQAITRAMGC